MADPMVTPAGTDRHEEAAQRPGSAEQAILAEGLCFHYPDGTPALRELSLSVQTGRAVGLIGANGAGKSTLLLHLNGLLRPCSGRLRVLGMEVVDRNLAAIRRQVGLLFQNPDDQLFMPTVFDEVAYAAVNAGLPRDEVIRRVSSALGVVGMEGSERKHPLNLSIGQKKRIALASVLVTDNRLLALDEPSAGLDPAGRRALISLMGSLSATMIIATHDLGLVEALCDTIAVMEAGGIAATGPTGRILEDDALLAQVGL